MSNTEQSRDSLKALFEDGDKPTGSNFSDLITTMATLDDTRYLTVNSFSDADWPFAPISEDVLIRYTPGSSVSSAVKDRNITTITNAVTWTDKAIIVPRSSGYTNACTFVSSNPTNCSVDANGYVTQNVGGDYSAFIFVNHPLVNQAIQLTYVSAPSTTAVNYTGPVTNTVREYCTNAVDTRLVGGKTKTKFTVQNHSAGIYTRDTNFWAYDIDTTCVSPWNSKGGAYYAGTAIHPRLVMFATHYHPNAGTTIRFIDSAGAVVDRVLTSVVQDTNNTDMTIGLLDVALPATVTPAKLLPDNYRTYLPTPDGYIPTICFDQEEKGLIQDLSSMSSIFNLITPYTTARLAFYEDKISGDSGNPAFLIYDGQLILLGTLWTGGAGGGYNTSANKSFINAQATIWGITPAFTEVDFTGRVAF